MGRCIRLAVYTITPVKRLDKGKARLASLLGVEGRTMLSLTMLRDVLEAISSADGVEEGVVVSSDGLVRELADGLGFTVLKDEPQRGVNEAVRLATDYCLSRGASSTLILPADIPLLKPRDVDNIVEASKPTPSVVITPSLRMDGTNALLRSPPEAIPTSYDQDSYRSHIAYASKMGLRLEVYRSRGVMLDIDTPRDLKEFLSVESETKTYAYLKSMGITSNSS